MIGTKAQCITYLANIKSDNKRYEVKEYRERRSLTANAYFHVLCDKIGEEITPRLSHTEVHNWLIADYGQLDEDVRTIILRDDIDWRKLDAMHLRPTDKRKTLEDGKLYRLYFVMRGSHTYNSKEMAMLIDGAIQEAQQLDIETATVSERDRMLEAWAKQYERKHNSAKRGQEVLPMFGMEPDGQTSLFVGNSQ